MANQFKMDKLRALKRQMENIKAVRTASAKPAAGAIKPAPSKPLQAIKPLKTPRPKYRQ